MPVPVRRPVRRHLAALCIALSLAGPSLAATGGMVWYADPPAGAKPLSSAEAAEFDERPPTCTGPDGKAIPCSEATLDDARSTRLVQAALRRQDFERLDALWERWCRGTDRLDSGEWLLERYVKALKQLGQTGSPQALSDTAAAWRRSRPQSEAARFAEVFALRDAGWKARGMGFSNTVSKAGWLVFDQRLRDASAAVEPLMKTRPCAAAYSLAIDLALETPASSAEEAALRQQQLIERYQEGAALYPGYLPVHTSLARALMPMWNGEMRAAPLSRARSSFESYVRSVVDLSRKSEGQGMYARIYAWTFLEESLRFDPALSVPAWKTLKASFDDLIKRHPNSLALAASYAEFACTAGDHRAYKPLRTRLLAVPGSRYDGEEWQLCDQRIESLAAAGSGAKASRSEPAQKKPGAGASLRSATTPVLAGEGSAGGAGRR